MIIFLWVISNSITLNWGKGRFTTGTTSSTDFQITLPCAVKSTNVGIANADVGNSGWQYLNGIGCTTTNTTQLTGRYCLGNVVSTPYSWIAIGY